LKPFQNKNMTNIYRKCSFKNLLLSVGLLLASSSLWAQAVNSGERKDSISLEKKKAMLQQVPGALFGLNKSGATAAVSTVSGDVLYKTPVANLTNTLYGQLPGLSVSQGSGDPGYDAATLWIRGIGSYNYGGYAIFVDGFQTAFNYLQYLSPSEIENVSIFKDAAALATFGMKGANGVIWVTTKRGHAGKPSIQLQARTGFKKPLNINKPLGSYDYAALYNEAVSNDNGRIWSPVFTASQLEAYKNGTGINTSWYDEVLKENAPFTTSDASISGGNETTRYFVMMSYLHDQGLYNVKEDDTHANAGLKQFNLRTNLDFNLFKIFEGKVDIGGRTEDRKYPNFQSAALWNNLERYPSYIYPAKNDDGTWPGTSTYRDNPFASINELGLASTHDRTLQANFTLKEKLDFITPGLYVSEAASFSTWTRGSYNVTKNYARIIDGERQTTDQNTTYGIFDDRGTNQWNWSQFQGQIGYDRIFGKQAVTAAVNYWQSTQNVDANQNGVAGINTKYAYQNIGARFHYEFDKRYSAEFSFAYSGSDNYAEGNRFGFYPALSAAWNLSNESFFKDHQHINQLKLRASVGKTGYDTFSGGRYLYQLYYANAGSYPTGNGTPTWNAGISPAYVPNPDIFAEQSVKYNFGADAKLFNRLDLTIDAFLDKRSDIVTADNSLLAVFGTTPPYKNIGKVTNKGIEASANFANQIGRLNYQIGGLVSYNTNRIDYMAEIPPVTPTAAQTGRSIGAAFGYEATGFYDITDFNSDGSLIAGLPVPGFGDVQPGDIKYKDISGDNRIDERDIKEIGNSFLPKVTYALHTSTSYAGFDFRLLVQGVSGRSVNLLDARNQTIAFQNNGNAYAIAQNRWAYYPGEGIDTRATATYPRLSTLGNTNNYRNSSLWMKNGSFLRMRNVELGYTLPHFLIEKVSFTNARIFVNGVNLFSWSPLARDYQMDPETMTGHAAFKSVNFGFTVNF
jgi:TonB-linked SusC/RagA family outer membrane protein